MFWNTLSVALAVIGLSLPLGVLLAWLLFTTDVPGRSVARWIWLWGLATPLVVFVAGWEAGFGQTGWFSRGWFSRYGIVLHGWPGVVVVQSAAAVSWITLLVAARFRAIPGELMDAARCDLGPWQILRHILLPHARIGCLAAAIWVVVQTTSEITITDVYQVATFAETVYQDAALGDNLTEIVSRSVAHGAIPFVAIALGLFIAKFFERAMDRSSEPTPSIVPVRRYWIIGLVVIAGFCWLIPWLHLVIGAGIVSNRLQETGGLGWSLKKCVASVFASYSVFREEYAWSIGVSQVAAIISVATACALVAGQWYNRYIRWAAIGIVALCLAVPGPLVGLILIGIFNSPTLPGLAYLYDETIIPMALASSTRSFPFVYILIRWAAQEIPTGIWENAAVDGISRWSYLKHILWPQMAFAIATAWLLAVLIALGDLSTSILVAPPGVTTLAIRIFGLVHYGVDDQLAALCLGFHLLLGTIVFLAGRCWTMYRSSA